MQALFLSGLYCAMSSIGHHTCSIENEDIKRKDFVAIALWSISDAKAWDMVKLDGKCFEEMASIHEILSAVLAVRH